MKRQDEVVGVLRRMEAAWNSGDATEYARLFAADAVYVTRSGELWQGRPAIEEGFAAALSGPLADTMVALRPAHVAFPALSVAVVIATVELSSETAATRAIATFILTLNGSEWSILAAQAGEIAAVH